MKIAFWSEQEKSGTTFNLAAVACAAALSYPLSVAVISADYEDDNLEQNFGEMNEIQSQELSGEQMAAEKTDYFITAGLDCLLLKKESGALTEAMVKSNMRQVIPGRMYCMPGGRRHYEQWWCKDIVHARMAEVYEELEHYFDLVLVDCGSIKNDFTRNIRRKSDICVLNMFQKSEMIGEYYRNYLKSKENIFFLVGNYFENAVYSRQNLQKIYRLEEDQIGSMPYNPQLQAAGQTGKTKGCVKCYLGDETRGKSLNFEQELARTTRLILKKAGVLE